MKPFYVACMFAYGAGRDEQKPPLGANEQSVCQEMGTPERTGRLGAQEGRACASNGEEAGRVPVRPTLRVSASLTEASLPAPTLASPSDLNAVSFPASSPQISPPPLPSPAAALPSAARKG